MPKGAIEVKAELVQSTAFLRREFLGRDNFRSREKTIYVFDTDVIKAYCAPWLTGPGRDQDGNGYGEPISFNDPDRKKLRIDTARRRYKAEKVSRILARYALNLSENLPVYQFQPQFDETAEVYGYVRNDAERVAKIDKWSQLDRQRRTIIQLSAIIASKRNGTGDTHDQDISFEVNHLINVLNNTADSRVSAGQQKLREWDAFVELNTKNGGIFPVSYSAKHCFRTGNLEVAHALEGFGDGKLRGTELADYRKQERFWRAALDRNSLNVRLSRIGWRAVFVTGSKNIVNASYSTMSRELLEQHEDALKEFGNRYVRHIWAYTSEALIEPHNRSKFVNWLDGLLAQWAERSEFRDEDLTKLVSKRSFPNVSIDDCREAYEVWDHMTANMVAQDQFISLGNRADDLKAKLVKRIETSRNEHLDWTKVSSLLFEDNDRENDESFLILSNIGAEALVSGQQTSRHPPDLDFETLIHTKKIFARLTSKDGYKSKADFEDDFLAIEKDCYDPTIDNRQYCHLKYLALGAAFASASRWSVALSQAQRAIRIVERSRDRGILPIPTKSSVNSHMSGREAYFLAAVSLRMISKHQRDFDGASTYLSKAEAALLADRDEETAQAFDDLRFLNERCALALSLYYFKRMESPDDYQNRCYDNIVDRLETALKPVKYFEPRAMLRSRRAATLAHVALNTIQAATISEFRRIKEQSVSTSRAVSKEALTGAINALNEMASDDAGKSARLFKTKLMKCYLIVGKIIAEGKDGATKGDVDQAFSDWESTVVTEYDGWRYNNLYDLATELLA